MNIPIYQIDAFTDKLFGGNPAAVCPLQQWLPVALMQQIAMENNLAETAFYVPDGDRFHIRWFTPAVEVDLCGHATLAAAFVLFQFGGYEKDEIIFNSRSGKLKVTKQGDLLTLDFPTDVFNKVDLSPELLSCFEAKPMEAYKGKTDYMLVFERESQVRNAQPDMAAIASFTDSRGLIITAKGDDVDFVSRFYAPQSGITEDPVTGSAHTTLTPYWSARLFKKHLSAIQLSPRKGYLRCTHNGDRVSISGQARLYMKGQIDLNDQ